MARSFDFSVRVAVMFFVFLAAGLICQASPQRSQEQISRGKLILAGNTRRLPSVKPGGAKGSGQEKGSRLPPLNIEWREDLPASIAMAKHQKKWVFVLMSASWCQVCKTLEGSVIPQEQVQYFLASHFICVKIDIDQPYGQAMRKQYHIAGVPCLMVFRADGRLQGQLSGAPRDARAFVSIVSRLAAGH